MVPGHGGDIQPLFSLISEDFCFQNPITVPCVTLQIRSHYVYWTGGAESTAHVVSHTAAWLCTKAMAQEGVSHQCSIQKSPFSPLILLCTNSFLNTHTGTRRVYLLSPVTFFLLCDKKMSLCDMRPLGFKGLLFWVTFILAKFFPALSIISWVVAVVALSLTANGAQS